MRPMLLDPATPAPANPTKAPHRPKTLVIIPNIEDTKWRGIHHVAHALIGALSKGGSEVGLLTGFPMPKAPTGAAPIDQRLANLNLVHYLREGRYAEPFRGNRSNLLKRSLTSAWGIGTQACEFKVNGTLASSLDFVVNVPHLLEYIHRGSATYERLPGHVIDRAAARYGIDTVLCAAPLGFAPSPKSKRTYEIVQFVHDTIPLDVAKAPRRPWDKDREGVVKFPVRWTADQLAEVV